MPHALKRFLQTVGWGCRVHLPACFSGGFHEFEGAQGLTGDPRAFMVGPWLACGLRP